MPLTTGTCLGSHEITALLGKGGMGEVYRARDRKLNRDVAIKILPGDLADVAARRRFEREAHEREPTLILHARHFPEFQQLRLDPQFVAILREMDVPEDDDRTRL